jgi:hypothetical protein
LEPARASNLISISTSPCLLFSVQRVSPNRHSSCPKTDVSRPRHAPHLCAAKDPLAARTPPAVAGQSAPRSARTAPYQPCLVCTHRLRYAYTNLISTTQRHSWLVSLKPTNRPGAGRDTAKHLCRQFGADRYARPWLLPLSECLAWALHLTGHAATAVHNAEYAAGQMQAKMPKLSPAIACLIFGTV